MYSYTLNINSWQMEDPKNPETSETAKKRNKKTGYPEISFIDAFRAKYPDWGFIIDEFTAAIGQKPTWKTIIRSNLIKFVDHLRAKFAPNTVNQYATRLKVVLNMYAEEAKLPYAYAKILSPKKIPSTAVFLDENELKLLEEYNPRDDYETLARNLFLCSAYSGARWIDIMRMNKSNIRGNELVFVAQKTHKEARLPLKPIVAQYIKEMPQISITDRGFIKILQRICRNVGITESVKILKAGRETEMPKYQAVTTHTARRSFATNLYLRGVDLYTISKLLQHSDTKLTAKYICVDMKPLDEAAMGYFG